jgi:hypothetical protein
MAKSALTRWKQRLHVRRELEAGAEKKLSTRRRQVGTAERQVAKLRAARRPKPRPTNARGRALAFCVANTGVRESPAGSNQGPKITEWQRSLGGWLVGAPWCGVFCAKALQSAGVTGVTWRLASVGFVEDDARAGRGPFRAWTTDPTPVLRGDLVILFGRGVHVGIVESVDRRRGVVNTREGNTSAGAGGNQSNGGGVYARTRPLSQVHGFARVDYPGK